MPMSAPIRSNVVRHCSASVPGALSKGIVRAFTDAKIPKWDAWPYPSAATAPSLRINQPPMT